MRKLRVAFIWEFANWSEFAYCWNDGYKAALDIVAKKVDLSWYVAPFEELHVNKNNYDVLMYWGGPQDKFHKVMVSRPERKLWLYPGGGVDLELARQYNVVFTEDKIYEDQLKCSGVRVIRATGSNTALFKPEPRKKVFGAIFPATFSRWKRQDIFAQAMRQEGLCIGTLQPDGYEVLTVCEEQKTKTIVGYLPAEMLVQFYNMSEVVILPVIHGSQRTLLEALGMNIPVVISNRFKCLVDLAEEIGGCKIVDLDPLAIRNAWLEVRGTTTNTRAYVVEHYGEEQFAEKLLRGIEER